MAKKFDIDEFRTYLAIDRANLDAEIVQQASLFYEVSEAYTMACAVRDDLADNLKATDANLDLKYRSNGSDENDGKLTENKIKNLVETDPKHEKAITKYLEAKAFADQIAALKEAFHQRSYMLRDLSALFIANYFERSSIEGNKDIKHSIRKEALAAERLHRTGSHGQSRRNRL